MHLLNNIPNFIKKILDIVRDRYFKRLNGKYQYGLTGVVIYPRTTTPSMFGNFLGSVSSLLLYIFVATNLVKTPTFGKDT
jgi:hypothetical protein